MIGQTTRREFLLSTGAGAVGMSIGLGGSMAIHAVGHATADSHSTASGEPTAVDFGFCTDMTVHHIQALAMCQRVLGRDTGDPVQAAAVEVLQIQAIEIGMMRAWLADWGQSTAEPELAMGWMSMHDDDSGTGGIPVGDMPGLASDEEMSTLGTASGVEQGRLWLRLMRAHHVGGVNMANAAAQMAGTEKVRRIATTQVAVQTYEIDQYDMLLATDYA